jgi:hypothetical protein
MRKMLLLIPVLLLLLSACAVAQVSYRLSDDFSVTVDYSVELQPGNTDAVQYTNAITQYWIEMGFATTFDEEGGVFKLTGTKQNSYDSPAAAAEAFSALLTSDNSLLQDARFIYTPSFEYDQYSLTASVALTDIIRQSDVQNIPEGEIESLEESAGQGTYALRIALPGDIVSTNAESREDGVCTWTLTYGGVTQISIETSKANTENLERYEALQGQQKRDEQLLMICTGAILVILVALVIVTIVRKRKDRPLKVRVKKY